MVTIATPSSQEIGEMKGRKREMEYLRQEEEDKKSTYPTRESV